MQDFPHPLPTIGSKHEISKSCILSRVPYEHDDLFKSRSELSGCNVFVRTAPIKRMPLLGDLQGSFLDIPLNGSNIIYTIFPTVEFSFTMFGQSWGLFMALCIAHIKCLCSIMYQVMNTNKRVRHLSTIAVEE